MTQSFESILGIHAKTLSLRSERSGLLAENLANVDTPNFKARDVDFKAVMKGFAKQDMNLSATHEIHLQATPSHFDLQPQYRVPLHPSLDGNTVTAHLEQAEFAENAVRYQASLMFLNRKLSGIRSALSDQ